MREREDISRTSRAAFPANQPRRILLAPAPAEPWATLLVERGWVLAAPDDEPDVVVRFGATSADVARRSPHDGVVHVTSKGETWAGEGADIVLFDPTHDEFIEACERALRLARARRMSSEHVGDVLESARDSFFVLDWDGLVAYQNRQALGLVARFEGGGGDVLGEPLDEHVPPEVGAALAPLIAATLRGAEPRQCEVHLPAAGTWIEASAYFIPGGAAVSLRDVTARKGVEASVVASLCAALRSETLAGMGCLASDVAHEIREPLASVASSLRSLGSAFERAAREGRIAEDVARAFRPLMAQGGDGVDRATDVVGRLQRFAEAQRGAEARFDLRDVVEQALRIERAATAGRVRIETACNETPPVRGDADRIRQIVGHLLRRAVDAMAGRAGIVRIATWAEPGVAVVAVEDQGPGMTPDVLERAFDPLSTTRPDGSGLGLWIVDRIVRDHGGTLEVRTAPDKGTRLALRFPADQEAAPWTP